MLLCLARLLAVSASLLALDGGGGHGLLCCRCCLGFFVSRDFSQALAEARAFAQMFGDGSEPEAESVLAVASCIC